MPARISLALVLFAAACGSGRPAGSGPYMLGIAGDTRLVLLPGDQRDLRVVLTQGDSGPVPGVRLHFAFVLGDAAGATLTPADPITDEHGVATCHLSVAQTPYNSPQVEVTAQGLDVKPAHFQLQISSLSRDLIPIESATTRYDFANHATTTVGPSTRTLLRVRVSGGPSMKPLPGEAVTFSREPGSRLTLGGETAGVVTARTGPEGEAQVLLIASQVPEGPVSIVATIGDLWVTFSVTVQAPAAQCSSSQTCAAGRVCVSGICQDPGAGSCTSSTCPAPAGMPDVTGTWLTSHTFDLRAALPAGLRAVGTAFRVLDQVLHGKIEIPGLATWALNAINGLLPKVLASYLPEWAPLAVQIGDDAFTLVSTLRAEGSMRLTRGADLAHPQGTEVWTNLVFSWLPLCGGNIGGDPTAVPDCARIVLPTTDAQNPAGVWTCKGKPRPPISVKLSPFTATLAQAGAGYTLSTGQRQVTLGMGAATRLLVDTMISLATQGDSQCIEELTDCSAQHTCIVDCATLGWDLSSWTAGIADPEAADAACRGAVTASGQLMADALEKAWPNALDVLSFQGSSSVSGEAASSECESGTSCASQLGRDDFEQRLRAGTPGDGAWTGSFQPALNDVPGAWKATRQP